MNPFGFDLGALLLSLRLFPLVPQPDWAEIQRELESQVSFSHVEQVDQALECGSELSALSAEKGTALLIPVRVQEGVFRLSITSSGGSGDADLYLLQESPPESTRYDRRPFQQGNAEQVQVIRPSAGRWYLAVHAYEGFEGLQVRMDCLLEPEVEEEVSYNDLQELELSMYYELTGDTVKTNRVTRNTLQFERLRQEGRQAFEAGNFDLALDTWKSWAVQEPENPRPVALVGDIHLRLGNVDKAVEWYEKS